MRISHLSIFVLFWILILVLTHGSYFEGYNISSESSQPIVITGTELLTEEISRISLEVQQMTPIPVRVDSTLSSLAIKRVVNGDADIGLLSRPLSWDERSKYPTLNQTMIGYDACAIVVSPSTRLISLTEEEVREIFTGKIRDFFEVGGASGDRIQVLGREPEDPSRNFFRKKALKTEMYTDTMKVFESDEEIIQAMEGPSSEVMIAQLPLSKVPDTLRVLSIRPSGSEHYIRPTVEMITQGKYPYTWPLYLVTRSDSRNDVQAFVNFLISPYGKELLVKEGIIPGNGS